MHCVAVLIGVIAVQVGVLVITFVFWGVDNSDGPGKYRIEEHQIGDHHQSMESEQPMPARAVAPGLNTLSSNNVTVQRA